MGEKSILRSMILILGIFLNVFVIFLAFPKALVAEEYTENFLQEAVEGFSCEIRVLASQTEQKVSGSPVNPENILQIPDENLSLDIRPDFFFEYRKLRSFFKPRYSWQWSTIEEGSNKKDKDFEDDLFVNEWLAGLQMIDSLFGSYGRENIQWGPSYLLSPSNPFFRENNLRNPKLEVRGQDFARLVLVPDPSWSFSFLANMDEGANSVTEDFEPGYAVKLDYTGYQRFFSLIPSYRKKDRSRLGAFAGWRLTDGLLLYAEGTASQGTDALYPTLITTQEGAQFIILDDSKKDSKDLETVTLLGTSYTFQSGSTLTMEYLYNSPGYNDRQANLFINSVNPIGRELGDVSPELPKNPASPVSPLRADPALDLKLSRLSKNYIYFQYQHSQIRNVLSLIFQYTYALDDNSSQLIPIVQYDLNDNMQLFLNGSRNFGSKEAEFRLLLDYSYFFGIQYTF